MTEPLGVETLTLRGRPRRHYIRFRADDGEELIQEFQPDGALLATYAAAEHAPHRERLIALYGGETR